MDKVKNYNKAIWSLSIGINVLIGLAYFVPTLTIPGGYDFSYIPLLNATLNGMTFITLILAFIAIMNKKIIIHRNLIFTALSFTGIFLGSYLLYHFTTPSTEFGGEGIIKIIYFTILITHILLATAIVPLALITISRGLNMNIPKHRKIARWVMPMWLYVSSTGVIVYFMISPYY